MSWGIKLLSLDEGKNEKKIHTKVHWVCWGRCRLKILQTVLHYRNSSFVQSKNNMLPEAFYIF